MKPDWCDEATWERVVKLERYEEPFEPDYAKQEKARSALRNAIVRGRILPPETCQRCGKNPGRGVDGRRLVQGHHVDYERPFEVIWLCVGCHRGLTPLSKAPSVGNPGEKNGYSKLTEQQVREIRASPLKLKDLAKIYGVAISQVGFIRQRKAWRHVD